jgi:hypothetical protein
MKLDENSQNLTAFTIPGRGQYHWLMSPIGLLGCPANFQQLIKAVLRDIKNVIIYINNLYWYAQKHTRPTCKYRTKY